MSIIPDQTPESPADQPGPAEPRTVADVLDQRTITMADLLARITEIRVMLARIEGMLSATHPAPACHAPRVWPASRRFRLGTRRARREVTR